MKLQWLRWVVWNPVQAGIAVYGLAANGYLAARFATGERWVLIALADNFLPWIALGALALSGLALFSRWRWLLITLHAPILIVFVALYGDRFVPGGAHAQAQNGRGLTVATFNIQSFYSDPQRIIQAITALDADIVGLEELSASHAALIALELGEQYPYSVLPGADAGQDVGLLSRYPVREVETFFSTEAPSRHLRAVVDVNGTHITVYVAHPSPPTDTYRLSDYDPSERNAQLRALREAVQADNGPLLVLCDCNMSDQSEAYRALDRLLDDAFREAGWGLGFTFPAHSVKGFPPLTRIIRIDYVWHSAEFITRDARVGGDSGGSDHHPVVADVVLKDHHK